ncbi:cation:proton antiporter [Luteitalea sp. TBR-22]|uniref:cation:proton antiporter domain-containing protein n=1 Tax=Luteitalea sp. TBR-22 TaxID=2802971 RepID=UPI001EF5FA9C|nr:cation:proton antiporter [Luteitalea sp. TBR-22]
MLHRASRVLVEYALLVGLPIAGVLLALQLGSALVAPPGAAHDTVRAAAPVGAFSLPWLLLSVAVLVACARVAGLAARAIGQPQVVGEMAMGIALGPSLLGWAAPALSATLFPAANHAHLNTLSQLGLLLFMFLVGLEFDLRRLRHLGHTAVLASHASITLPMLLGVSLALYLYPRLSSADVRFHEFALFMGTAMSVTAFPVLARILRERRLTDSRIGTVAIACAAVDDVTAWCLLAGIVALVRASQHALPVPVMVGGLAAFIAVVALLRRAGLGVFLASFEKRRRLSEDSVALLLTVVMLASVTTEWLGLHLLFGAFFVGVMLPKTEAFVDAVTARFELVATTLLLPVFFAYTGLRTQIGLVVGAQMWFYCALILVLAIVGKLVGSAVAARVTGLNTRDSLALGVLMNTRGLMELVVLNLGLDLGIISPALFSMLVVMALVTTVMTTPLLARLYPSAAAGVIPVARPASAGHA